MAAASSAAATSAIGAAPGTTETPQDAFAYFVNALNAAGGIDGRKVQVVEDFVDPESTNYDNQASAACQTFTQDHHVAVVFSVEGGFYSSNFSACMAKAGVPEFAALSGGTDTATLDQFPTLFSITAPTVERRYGALIAGLTGNGFLTKSTKIGILVEDCPYDQAAYSEVIGPQLAAKGFTVYRRDMSCVSGFGDAGSAIAQTQAAVLPFETDGVSRVMFVSGFESLLAEFFQNQAQSQGYAPYYALTSAANAGANAMGFSAQAMSRVQGVGWDPDEDVSVPPAGTAATARCHALWKGYAPASQRGNLVNNDTTCEEFFALAAALKLSNGNSSPAAILSDMRNLGSSFVSPMDLGGAATFSAQQKDGPDLFAAFGYAPSCSCFQYTSAPKPFGATG